jgi:hypothetical protein
MSESYKLPNPVDEQLMEDAAKDSRDRREADRKRKEEEERKAKEEANQKLMDAAARDS